MRRWWLPLFLLLGMDLAAQSVVQSVGDGDWTDASTWDCACVPLDGDTVLIGHTVSLATDLTFLGGYLEVGAAGSIDGMPARSLTSTSRFTNHGAVQLYCLTLLDGQSWTDPILNTGTINATRMALRRRGVNTGVITTIDSLVFDRTSFWNEGAISSRVTWVRDSLLWNEGQFISYDLTIDSTGLFHNVGSCDVVHDLVIRTGSNYTAGAGSTLNRVQNNVDLRFGLNIWAVDMVIGARLFVNDADLPFPHLTFFVAGGSIHCKDLVNRGWLAGPGTICISDSSINEGSLQPGLVICDATTTTTVWPFLDVDQGTVDPGILFCPAGSCAVAIGERSSAQLSIAPNPASDNVTFEGMPAGAELRIYDGLGQLVLTPGVASGTKTTVDVGGLPKGIYLATATKGKQRLTTRLVVE